MRYFVTVADELHFGHAAERLQIAQPGLSRSIQNLEQKLGVTLFVRSSREVTLTEAGQLLVGDARSLLAQGDRLAERARSISAGDLGELTFGYLPLIQETAEYLIRSFSTRHPNITLRHRREYQDGLLTALAERRDPTVDISLLIGPTPGDRIADLGLASMPLCTRSLICVVSPGHPLSGRQLVELGELGAYPVAAYSSPGGEVMLEVLRPRFKEAGTTLRPLQVQDSVLTVPAVLAQDPRLIWLQTREFASADGLSSASIEPPLLCPFHLVYQVTNTKPALAQFLDHARETDLTERSAADGGFAFAV